MSHGNYYATTRRPSTRPGSTAIIGTEIGRQIRTLNRAMALVDAADLPGYVQLWSEHAQSRTTVAERDKDGVWTCIDPFTGERVPVGRS